MTSIEVEKLEKVEELSADDRGRVSLGSRFSNATFKVIVDDVYDEVESEN